MVFNYNNQEYKLILLSIAGSRLYGTYFNGKGSDREHPLKPEYISDYDYRGIFIAPVETKIGLVDSIEQIDLVKKSDEKYRLLEQINEELGLHIGENDDFVLYEVRKFFRLACESSPNILDLLFIDDKALRYITKEGRKILENKKKFLSKKIKFTFGGYATSQLNKIKGHNKMMAKWPKVNEVVHILKEVCSSKDIDFNWISKYFSGQLAKYICGITQQEAKELPKIKSLEWDEFVKKYEIDWDIENYRKPKVLDYCYPKELDGTKIELNDVIDYKGKQITVKEFLQKYATFRAISKTLLNIFESADGSVGIMGRDGKIKVHPAQKIGKFRFQLSIDDAKFNKDYSAIEKLWEWRVNRNPKRSTLEERFGYDTKNAAHLVRLMIGAKSILEKGDYKPRLEGKDLEFVMEILAGKLSYDEIIEVSSRYRKEIDELYKESKLQKNVDLNEINKLLVEISKSYETKRKN